MRKSVWVPLPPTRGDGRRGDAQQIGAEVVHAHRALRRRPAHHVGGLADVERIADVALGERDVDVAEPLGGRRTSTSVGSPGPGTNRAGASWAAAAAGKRLAIASRINEVAVRACGVFMMSSGV